MSDLIERIKKRILDYYTDMIDGKTKISCNDFMLYILKCFDEESAKGLQERHILYVEERLQAIKEIATWDCNDNDIDNILNFCDEIYSWVKESANEPQIDIPVQCVDGSCPMALSDEYEECGMDVVHSCDECQYRHKEPQVVISNVERVRTPEEIAEMRCDMKRLTHRYTDRQAFVSMNMLIPVMENEIVGLPITKLAHYEDLEEQGKLIELPCKVGDTVFVLMKRGGATDISNGKVRKIHCGNDGIWWVEFWDLWVDVEFGDFGKSAFLTHEEAESKLSEMEDGHGCA